jgi:flagellar basal-body rod protein FlgF
MYLGMNGAARSMTHQTVQANNLANVSTTGFRADLVHAIAKTVTGPGLESRVYNDLQGFHTDFSQGSLIETGNELDVAIAGEGFIAVQTPDGGEAYTRAGDLKLSPFGELLTGNGLPVLGNAGPIAIPPNQKIEIGSDGTLSVLELGQGAAAVTALDRILLVNPPTDQLEKGGDGLFRRRDGAAAEPDGAVRLQAGFIEASNVNVVDALVNMISMSRHYEMNVKMIQSVQENSETSARLLQVS